MLIFFSILLGLLIFVKWNKKSKKELPDKKEALKASVLSIIKDIIKYDFGHQVENIDIQYRRYHPDAPINAIITFKEDDFERIFTAVSESQYPGKEITKDGLKIVSIRSLIEENRLIEFVLLERNQSRISYFSTLY